MKTINEHLYLPVPMWAEWVDLVEFDEVTTFCFRNSITGKTFDASLKGSYDVVCLASEMTEEVAKGLVELSDDENCLDFYKCYDSTISRSNGITSQTIAFAAALESFHSLMEANEMYLVNPIPKPVIEDYLSKPIAVGEAACEMWQSYQDKLSDYVILKRK